MMLVWLLDALLLVAVVTFLYALREWWRDAPEAPDTPSSQPTLQSPRVQKAILAEDDRELQADRLMRGAGDPSTNSVGDEQALRLDTFKRRLQAFFDEAVAVSTLQGAPSTPLFYVEGMAVFDETWLHGRGLKFVRVVSAQQSAWGEDAHEIRVGRIVYRKMEAGPQNQDT